MKEVELKSELWKIGGIEVPREDGQSFEVGKWQMLWKEIRLCNMLAASEGKIRRQGNKDS